jgi:ATP-dependent Clp protease ATP-binding subunit ClpA
MIQKAFLADDPVIISTTNETEYNQRLASVSAVAENSQIVRVPEPSIEETIEILMTIKPHLKSVYDIEITPAAMELAARLSRRYLAMSPLPLSAEHLLHRTAAMVNMSKQSHLAFRPELKTPRWTLKISPWPPAR